MKNLSKFHCQINEIKKKTSDLIKEASNNCERTVDSCNKIIDLATKKRNEQIDSIKNSYSLHIGQLLYELNKEFVELKNNYNLSDAFSLLLNSSNLLYEFDITANNKKVFSDISEGKFSIAVDNPKIKKSFVICNIYTSESDYRLLIKDIFLSKNLNFLTHFNSYFFVVDDMSDEDYEVFNNFLSALHEDNEKAMAMLNQQEDLIFFPIDLYKKLIDSLPIDIFYRYIVK